MKSLFRVKIAAFFLLLSSGVVLTGCGNRQFIDTTYTYNYAQFKLPDGTIMEGQLTKWSDYEGEQLQLRMADGNVYLVNSVNTVLSVRELENTTESISEMDETSEDIQD